MTTTTEAGKQEVRFGPREWIAALALLVTVLGLGTGQLLRSEARFTKLETQLESLAREVNQLRESPRQLAGNP